MHPLILAVFGFLESIPEESIPHGHMSSFAWGDTPEELRRKKLADFINSNFHLQSRECHLRETLAKYRLFYRDDMALALAQAYIFHRCGQEPEQALTADFCPGFLGLLKDLETDTYRKADPESWNGQLWRTFARNYEVGDRFVSYNHRHSLGYLLFRGERLVWKYESAHLSWGWSSLRWNTDADRFIALGNTKGFLNGEFIWPPTDWVNPVTDEQEKAYMGETRERLVPRSSLNYPEGRSSSTPQ
jgi:hypothetical protein